MRLKSELYSKEQEELSTICQNQNLHGGASFLGTICVLLETVKPFGIKIPLKPAF